MSQVPKLRKRIEENLGRYYPGESLRVKKIEKVSELYKEGLETRTFRCDLAGENKRTVFVKYFSKGKIRKIGGLDKYSKIDRISGKLMIPRIIDVYKDMSMVLFEGVAGEKMSKLIPIYYLPFYRNKRIDDVRNIINNVAKSTATLHKQSYKNKAQGVISYNDLKLGNVLYDGKNAYIIDFELVKTHFMEDITTFFVSLEMLEKFPHMRKRDVEELKDIFLKNYRSNVTWEVDSGMLDKRLDEQRKEVLRTLTTKKYRKALSWFSVMIVGWNARHLQRIIKESSESS